MAEYFRLFDGESPPCELEAADIFRGQVPHLTRIETGFDMNQPLDLETCYWLRSEQEILSDVRYNNLKECEADIRFVWDPRERGYMVHWVLDPSELAPSHPMYGTAGIGKSASIRPGYRLAQVLRFVISLRLFLLASVKNFVSKFFESQQTYNKETQPS